MRKFKWLIKVLEKVKGCVIKQVTHPFSVDIMDAGFNFASISCKAIIDYLSQEGIKVDSIAIYTQFHSELNRMNTKMETETELIIIEAPDGKKQARLYLGGLIFDPEV